MSRGDLIVVMTTNNYDALDPALVRKGRINATRQVSLPDKRSVEQYMSLFYDKDVEIASEPNKAMCEVQDICLNTDDSADAIEKVDKLFA
jgi:ATP-dependent 26S proteasome regulatory subunit